MSEMRKHAARMLHILVDRVPETERRVFVNGRALRTTKIIAVAWRALDDEEEAQEAVTEVAAELASDEGGKFERFARSPSPAARRTWPKRPRCVEQAVSVGKLFAAVACSVSQWCRNAYATTVLVLKKHKQRILDEQLLTPEPRRFFAQDGSGSSSPQTTLRCKA